MGRGPPIYLVHGWGGQRAHVAIFVKPLVAQGYRVIASDLHRRLEKRIGMQLYETNMTWNGRLADYPPLLLIHDPDGPDSPACHQ